MDKVEHTDSPVLKEDNNLARADSLLFMTKEHFKQMMPGAILILLFCVGLFILSIGNIFFYIGIAVLIGDLFIMYAIIFKYSNLFSEHDALLWAKVIGKKDNEAKLYKFFRSVFSLQTRLNIIFGIILLIIIVTVYYLINR